jgi:exonuclease III
MERYRLEILCISEMQWTGTGHIKKAQKSILYSGHDTKHIHGVGIVLGKEATKALIAWKPVDDRIITARINSKYSKITVIQVFAPTHSASNEDKDDFYNKLHGDHQLANTSMRLIMFI